MRFDPYREWLDLPDGPRPPHPYALLGLPQYERDHDRIVEAAAVRTRQVRHQAPFDRVVESQRLLREIEAAKTLLLDADRRRRIEMKLRRAEKTSGRPSAVVVSTASDHEPSPARSALPLAAGIGAACLLTFVILGLVWSARRTGDEPGSPDEPIASVDAAPATETEHGPDAVLPAEPARPVVEPEIPVAPVVTVAEVPAPSFADREPVTATKPAPRPSPTVAVEEPLHLAPVEAHRPVVRSLAAYRVPNFASESDATAYAGQLRAMLAEGLSYQGGNFDAALRQHRELRRLSSDTALADYALGLVCWKRLRLDEAATHFAAARDSAAGPFLPAWQASIQLHLKRNRRDAALDDAVAFAKALASIESDEGRDAARDDSLRWLGRLTATLESPWRTDEIPPQNVLDAERAIRGHLGDALTETYKDGRRSMRDDLAVETETVAATIAARVAQHDEQQAKDLDALATERDAAGERRVTVARTVEELEKRLDEQTFVLDAQIKELTPQLRQLTTQVEAARTTLALINEQIALELEIPREDRPPIATLGSNRLLAAREQALVQFRLVSRQAADVQQQVEALMNQRRVVVAEFENATRKLAAERGALTKLEGVLLRRTEKTQASEAEDAPAVRALRRRLQEIGTYVPFDVEAERDTVLRVLEQSASGIDRD